MIAQKIPLASGLWLVGVPIGTARDITLRALDVLHSADILTAEDTRSLRKLMDIHGVPLASRRLLSLHDHSSSHAIETIVEAIRREQSVAYASEAGMPLIADPGFELVKAVRAAGLRVTSAPGPSALTTALALGGLGTDRFHFAGFLPNARAARCKALEALATVDATLVFFESPKRIGKMLADAAEILGPERQARICRELTKKFEEVVVGTLHDLSQATRKEVLRGEIVVLIERAAPEIYDETALRGALEDAMQTLSLKDAVAAIAVATKTPRRDVYRLALALKD